MAARVECSMERERHALLLSRADLMLLLLDDPSGATAQLMSAPKAISAQLQNAALVTAEHAGEAEVAALVAAHAADLTVAAALGALAARGALEERIAFAVVADDAAGGRCTVDVGCCVDRRCRVDAAAAVIPTAPVDGTGVAVGTHRTAVPAQIVGVVGGGAGGERDGDDDGEESMHGHPGVSQSVHDGRGRRHWRRLHAALMLSYRRRNRRAYRRQTSRRQVASSTWQRGAVWQQPVLRAPHG
jgi:hypothetical protein